MKQKSTTNHLRAITVRFPPELRERVAKLAAINHRTINGEVAVGMEFYLAAQEKGRR